MTKKTQIASTVPKLLARKATEVVVKESTRWNRKRHSDLKQS